MTGPPDAAVLLGARSTRVLDEDAAGRLLLQCDTGGTGQLQEWVDGAARWLTALPEPASGRWLPGTRHVVVAMDSGGDERTQLFLLDLALVDGGPVADPAALVPITADPAHVYRFAGARPDGGAIAWTSNRRNGIDFDVYVADVERTGGTVTIGPARCVHDGGGWCGPASGWSPDGRYLAVLRAGAAASMTEDLLVVDTATGDVRHVLRGDGGPAVTGPPAWCGPAAFVASSNAGREFAALVHVDLATGEERVVLAEEHDLDVRGGAAGTTVLVTANVDGSSRTRFFRVDRGALVEPVDVDLPEPDAIVAHTHLLPPPVVAPDGGAVTMTVSAPRLPGDVWRWTPDGGAVRLTTTPFEVDPAALAVPERHRLRSFDGLEVPAFVYRPRDTGEGPTPAVLVIHGGPEGQSTTTFNPVVQALAARGYAVVVPNVRGSIGYGRTYYGLDDTTRRLDSVADLGAVHDWLPSIGLDADRAALWGVSYGGYMVLAGLAFQPERWAAGVDIVGISDLVTFLENTAPYRRAVREAEYGSLDRDREFLAAASPLRRAGDIRAPLVVIHGANDPRVPVSEAEQLVAVLRDGAVPCELLVYADEGHGLARLGNRLDAYPRAIDFLDRHLRAGEAPVTAGR